jgi:hypothetical protein
MTNQEYYDLFSEAIQNKKIIRYENSTSRDDYSIYAIRKTPEGYVFFCLLETFFRKAENREGWKTGSLSSYPEFHSIKGAARETLQLTSETFTPRKNFEEKLPVLGYDESQWVVVQ